MRFTKMQGCGNDYIYINCFAEKVENPEKLAIAMSERHFGVGSDGLVLIMPSEAADFRMRMFNLDGSEGKMHPVIGETVEILDRKFDFTCVSMGNPHAVTFVENVMEYPIEKYGRVSEFHPIFPDRVNTEFVEIVDDSHVKMRVWERGSGETWACGTGASATAVACVLNGKTDRKVDVELIGGTLTIEWNAEDNHVYMTGPAEFSFDGEWLREV